MNRPASTPRTTRPPWVVIAGVVVMLGVVVALLVGPRPVAAPDAREAEPTSAGAEPDEPAGPTDANGNDDDAPDLATIGPELAPFFRLIEQRQTGPARVRLRKHLDRNPDDGLAAFLFGLSYHREKRYELARPWFDRALEHAPDYYLSHYFLAWGQYYLGNIEEAKRGFERHLEHDPDAGDAHFGLGLVALDQDRLDDAETRFRRALELEMASNNDKGVSKARTRLADVHMLRGEFDDAQRELTLAVARFPDHYEAYYKLYRVLTRLGETEAAEDAHARFVEARQRLHPGTRFPE